MAEDARQSLTEADLEEVLEFGAALMQQATGRVVEPEQVPCAISWIDDGGEERFLILNTAEEI